jgi:hypothetical protein
VRILWASALLFCSIGLSQILGADDAVEVLYSQALAAKRSGDLNTAIDKYRAILKLSPKLAAAHNNLGLFSRTIFLQPRWRSSKDCGPIRK